MSRPRDHRCALCLDSVSYGGPGVMPIEIVEPRCAVTLRWHMTCAHADPLFARLGEAVELDPTGEVDPFRDAYHAVLDRTIAADVALLPCVADVRRDIDEIRPTGERVTLRAPCAAWGRPAIIPKRGIRMWP